jgi:hypothetical protein
VQEIYFQTPAKIVPRAKNNRANQTDPGQINYSRTKPKKKKRTNTKNNNICMIMPTVRVRRAPLAKALNTNQSSRHNLPKAAVTSSGQGMEGQTNKGERGRNLYSFP